MKAVETATEKSKRDRLWLDRQKELNAVDSLAVTDPQSLSKLSLLLNQNG